MDYIFAAAFGVATYAFGQSMYDLFFAPELPDFEEDMFSTLPWGEIIESV